MMGKSKCSCIWENIGEPTLVELCWLMHSNLRVNHRQDRGGMYEVWGGTLRFRVFQLNKVGMLFLPLLLLLLATLLSMTLVLPLSTILLLPWRHCRVLLLSEGGVSLLTLYCANLIGRFGRFSFQWWSYTHMGILFPVKGGSCNDLI